MDVLIWAVSKFVPYSRNLRKNHQAVAQMAASIQEYGLKFQCWHVATVKSLMATYV